MRTEQLKKTLVISMILLLVGASVAFARGGNWGDRGGPRMMAGERMGSGMGPNLANLNEEQRAELNAARETFFAETGELRDQIREKRWALRDELAKSEPDATVAIQLQEAISQLQSTFDQYAVNHKLEVRRILPDDVAAGGFSRGHKGGGGYCWR